MTAGARRLLPRRFYDRPTLRVARELLGKVLVHRRGRTVTSGVIVEVEAYIGESDPACHAAPGPTPRNRPLYGPPGFAYVYLNYGMHYLVNVVTEAEGQPAAVLIRALDPLDGIATMRRRRGLADAPAHGLCRGPGNVTKAMGVALVHNQTDLLGDRLRRRPGHPDRPHCLEPAHRHQRGHGPSMACLRGGMRRGFRGGETPEVAEVTASPGGTGKRSRATALDRGYRRE